MMMQSRIMQTAVLSLIVAAVYSNIGNGQDSISTRQGALFLVAMTNFMGGLSSTVLTFGQEKPIFVREVQSRLYRSYTYFLGKLTSELPLYLVFPTAYAVICYFIIGLQGDVEKFFQFLLAITLLSIAGVALGLVIGSIASTASGAASLMPAFMLPFLLFSGFFVTTDNIPLYFRWIQYISPIYYSLSSLLISEFSGLQLTCTAAQKINGACPYASGDVVLSSVLSLNANDWSRDIGILVAFIFLVLCIAYSKLHRGSQ